MLVKKKVFALSALRDCTLEEVKRNCCYDLIHKLCEINRRNSTEEYDVADIIRLNKLATEISFDTNLLKFEMSIDADTLIETCEELVTKENEYRLNNNSRIDTVSSDDENKEVLMLNDQIFDVLTMDGCINIKIINSKITL